jgi:hyperosmotically inducible periplasmic protein
VAFERHTGCIYGSEAKMKLLIPVLLTLSAIVPAAMYAKDAKPVTLPEAVRHSLAMMPRFSVFDELKFSVDGGTVTLTGQVTQPIVKDDAASAVIHVEGITNVVNNIEVLPLSPDDDRLRMAVYRAIYGDRTLAPRYGFQAQPPIHIIVKNGMVRLEGVVANSMDRTIAGIRAQGVFGAFQVENDLQVG